MSYVNILIITVALGLLTLINYMIRNKKIAVGGLIVATVLAVVPFAASAESMITVPQSFLVQLASILTGIQSQLSSGNGSTAPRTDTKSADLRVLLNSLERQHVDLASAATRAGFDGHASFDKVAAELDKNSVSLADAVGSVYGTAARDQFLTIWRSHIGFFVDYTVGAKTGDKAKMDTAVKNLTEGYVPAIADFFSKANPNLPREAVAQLVTQHVLLLKAAVDTYGAGDFAGSYSKQTEAYNQIGKIADALSGAIVKQHSELF